MTNKSDQILVGILTKRRLTVYLTTRDKVALEIDNCSYPILPEFFLRDEKGKLPEMIIYAENCPAQPLGYPEPLTRGEEIYMMEGKNGEVYIGYRGKTMIDKLMAYTKLLNTNGIKPSVAKPAFDWSFLKKYWYWIVMGVVFVVGYIVTASGGHI